MKSFQSQTHYEVLEISVGADVDEIRAAYARLTRLYSDEQVALYGLVDPLRADLLRKRLKQAVEVLTDEARRDAYDVTIGLPPRDRPLPPRPSGSAVEVAGAWGQSFSWVAAPPAAAPSAPSPTVYAVSVEDAVATRALVPSAPPRPSRPPSSQASPAQPVEPPAPRPTPAQQASPAPAMGPRLPTGSVVAPAAAEAPLSPPSREPAPEPMAPAAPLADAVAIDLSAASGPAGVAGGAPAQPERPPDDARAGDDGARAAADVRAAAPPAVASAVDEVVAPRTLATDGAEEAPRPAREPAAAEDTGAVSLAPSPPAAAAEDEGAPATAAAPSDEGPFEAPQAGEGWDDAALPRLSDDAEVSIISARATPRDYRAEPRPRPYEVPPGVEFNGDLLRQVRMARGLSLVQVSERTRISVKHIENVEGDRYEALPAPVYLRGILMSLARELGLDGLRVSRSYLAFVEARRAKG